MCWSRDGVEHGDPLLLTHLMRSNFIFSASFEIGLRVDTRKSLSVIDGTYMIEHRFQKVTRAVFLSIDGNGSGRHGYFKLRDVQIYTPVP